MPTKVFLIVTRADCFCPEKAVGFELSENVAINEKMRLEERDNCTYHVVECVIMTRETFQELCPDWA